jgi:hypothetical protein
MPTPAERTTPHGHPELEYMKVQATRCGRDQRDAIMLPLAASLSLAIVPGMLRTFLMGTHSC